MSLSYRLPESNLPYLLADDQWDYTFAFIFRMMAIGVTRVTPSNVESVYLRNKLYHKLFGGVDFTYPQTEQFIGLTANVTSETDLQWRKRITEQFMLEELHKWGREKREAEALTNA